jgi:hypothetical protein
MPKLESEQRFSLSMNKVDLKSYNIKIIEHGLKFD